MRRTLNLYEPEFPDGWYLLGRSDELRRGQARALELGDEKLVAFRTQSGRLVVTGRYCPHMGAALNHGKVVGERIRCPFHAWEFDSGGQCVAAPDVAKVPPGARLHCVHTAERQGFAWVYRGQAAAPSLPLTPELDDPASVVRYRYADLDIHPLMVLENAADPLHIRYVHKTAFDDFSTELLADDARCLTYRITLSKRSWLGERGGSRVEVLVRHPGPGYLLADMSSGGRLVAKIVAAPTPLSKGRVRMHHISVVRRLPALGPANSLYARLIARVLFRGVTDDYGPVWRDMRREGPRLLVKSDSLQQKVRAFYWRGNSNGALCAADASSSSVASIAADAAAGA